MKTTPDTTNSVTYTLNDIHFGDIFILEDIQRLQDLFADTQGVASIITHPDGAPITNPSNFCRLCNNIIRKTEKGRANCFKSDALIGNQNPSGSVMQPCLSGGLWDAGASITVGGKHIANWLIGQVRNEELDEKRMIQYADEIGANRAEFMEALNEVPVMSVEQFKKVSNMLFAFANELSEKAYNNLQLKMQIAEHEKATVLLKESEERYRTLFERSNDAIFFVETSSGKYLDANRAAEIITGRSLYELKKLTTYDTTPKGAMEHIKKALVANDSLDMGEVEYVRTDGTLRTALLNIIPLTGNRIFGIAHDITESKQVEEALRENEIKYRELVENSPDAIAIYVKGEIVFTNNACVRLMAAESAEKLIGKSVLEFVHPDYRRLVVERMIKVAAEETVLQLTEEKFVRLDGSEVDVEVKAMPIKFENKHAVQLIVRDITERKHAAEKLQKSEEKYHTLFENVQDVFFQTDLAGIILEISPSIKYFSEFNKNEILGTSIFNFYNNPEDRAILLNTITLSGEIRDYELTLKTKTGQIKYVSINARLVFDPDGRPNSIDGAVRDITDRKRAEEALIKSEHKYRKLHESMIDGFAYIDMQGFIKDYNESFKQLIGYGDEELSILTYKDVTPEKWHDYEDQIITNQVLVRGFSDIYEKEYRKKDGTLFPVEIHTFLVKDDAGENEGMWAIVRDITERKRAKKALIESRQQLLDILDFLPDATFVVDNENKVIAWNKAIEEMTGVQKQDMIGKGDHAYAIPFYGKKQNLFLDLIDNNNEELTARYSNVSRKGLTLHAEIFAPALSDGKGAFLSVLGAPFFNSSGERVGNIESMRDITDHKQAESVLRFQSEIMRNINEAIYMVRMDDGIIVYTNSQFEKMFGYESGKMLGKHVSIVNASTEKNPEVTANEIMCSLAENGFWNGEVNNIRKDGSTFWSYAKVSIFDHSQFGKVLIAVQEDITERKQAKEALLKLKKAIDTSGEAIFLTDREGVFTFVNPAFASLYGYTSDEIVGKTTPRIIKSGVLDKSVYEGFWQTLLNRNEFKGELINKRKDGTLINIDGSATPIIDEEKNIIGFLGIQRDISERKRAEKSLREQADAMEATIDGLAILNADGNYIYINKAHVEIYGYDNANELIGASWRVLYDTGELQRFDHEIMPELNQKGHYQGKALGRKKDGSIFHQELSLTGLQNGGLICVVRDITERVKAEEALRKSEEKFRTIFNESPIGIELYDADGVIKTANKSDLNMFGLTDISEVLKFNIFDGTSLDFEKKEKLRRGEPVTYQTTFDFERVKELQQYKTSKIGRADFGYIITPLVDSDGKTIHGYLLQVQDITDRIHAEKAIQKNERALVEAQQIGRIGSWEYDIATDKPTWSKQMFEIFGLNPDHGEPTWKEHHGRIHPDDWEMLDTAVMNAVTEGIPYNIEFRLLHPTKGVKWTWTVGQPEFDTTGKVVRLKGTSQDIDDRKLAEQELIEAKEHSEESDKLKTAFLNNISHEIRTPFNGILGFLTILQDDDLTTTERDEYTSIINKSSYRLMNTINDIVEISQIQTGQLKMIASKTNIKKLTDELFDRFKTDAENQGLKFTINNDLPDSFCNILTDYIKLKAILSILIGNAIKFTKSGFVELNIKCRDKACAEIEFSIRDTGIGVPENKQQVIFERFIQADGSSTRKFEGSGLGLSIAKAYTEILGGEIWVESDSEGKSGAKGSVFYLTIPCNCEPQEKNVTGNIESADIAENKIKPIKILIVEDDKGSAKLLEMIVRKFGKEIIKVRTGVEAVETCRKNPDIDLIFMDIKLPGMDGHEATKQIRQFNKEVIIIVQTSYALTGDHEMALAAGCNDYISKPIKKDLLIELLKKYFKRE